VRFDPGRALPHSGLWRVPRRFLSGEPSRRTLFAFILPAAFLSYFGPLALAVHLLPASQDWRSLTISKLALNPQNNPRYSSIASSGVKLAAGLTIPLAGFIGRGLRRAAPLGSRMGEGLFRPFFVAFAGSKCRIYRGNQA